MERAAVATAPRARRGLHPGEWVALALSAALTAALVLDLGAAIRLPLALAFSAWVPGAAVAAWMPRLSSPERRGVAVTVSLALTVLAATVAVWLDAWRPGVVFAVLAAGSVAALVAASRRVGDTVRAASWRDELRGFEPPLAAALGVAALAGAVGLWQLSRSDHVVARWGLLPQLPLAWFLAAAALAVGAALALRSGRRPALGAVAVLGVLLLHGVAAAAYAAPRFSWTAKHVGVVDYLVKRGHLTSGIDIYHNWPGFFALAGQVFELGGVRDPSTLLRWWPALIGLAGVVVLRFFLGALTDDARVQWGAVLLFVVANWFAQDYFAPQSIGFLLAFGTFGLLLRTNATPERDQFDVGRTEQAWLAGTAIVVFLAITVTHQLTPYLVLPGIVLASLLGGIRPRWVAAVCAAIALAYLAPRFGWVRAHGGVGSTSVGDNVRSPAAELAGAAWSVTVSNWASRLLTGGMMLLSIPYLLRFRRDRWWTAFLLSNLVGPVFVLLVQAYGNEGVLRSALFVTPWMAFAAMSTVVERRGRPVRATAFGAMVAAGLTLFALATWGLDARYRIGPDEQRVVRAFENNAPAGAVLAQLGPQHLPVRATARYPQFEYTVWATFAGPDAPNVPGALRQLERAAAGVSDRKAVYVASTSGADRFAQLFGYGRARDYAQLRAAMERSGRWRLLIDEDGALLARWRG